MSNLSESAGYSVEDQRPLVKVVAAVIFNSLSEYLLSSRPEGKAYAGYWEFAGGKVESGETSFDALQRELHEELGITITDATPWLTKIHSYEHARVHLQFFRVQDNQWHGDLQAKEGQKWAWQKIGLEHVSPMLPANGPILKALAIPSELLGSFETGFYGENAAGSYRVAPLALLEPHHHHVLLSQSEWKCHQSLPAGKGIWLIVDNIKDWSLVQDADAVVWHVQSADSATSLQNVLIEGVAMPVIVYAQQPWCHQANHWLAMGAHAVILADEVRSV